MTDRVHGAVHLLRTNSGQASSALDCSRARQRALQCVGNGNKAKCHLAVVHGSVVILRSVFGGTFEMYFVQYIFTTGQWYVPGVM